jgi:hypothetical protein
MIPDQDLPKDSRGAAGIAPVKSDGGGTNSRVQLQFTRASTGERIDFRYEFGKTVIG